MSDDGRLVGSLEIERKNDEGKYIVVNTITIKPPKGEFSRGLEKIMRGILMQGAEDMLIYEIGTDGTRLD